MSAHHAERRLLLHPAPWSCCWWFPAHRAHSKASPRSGPQTAAIVVVHASPTSLSPTSAAGAAATVTSDDNSSSSIDYRLLYTQSRPTWLTAGNSIACEPVKSFKRSRATQTAHA
jgi:hypothetical protein